MVNSLLSTVFQLRRAMVALAGSSTRTRRRPAVTVLPLIVGCTGTCTWKNAVVPAAMVKLSRTVSLRAAKSRRRVQALSAGLPL